MDEYTSANNFIKKEMQVDEKLFNEIVEKIKASVDEDTALTFEDVLRYKKIEANQGRSFGIYEPMRFRPAGGFFTGEVVSGKSGDLPSMLSKGFVPEFTKNDYFVTYSAIGFGDPQRMAGSLASSHMAESSTAFINLGRQYMPDTFKNQKIGDIASSVKELIEGVRVPSVMIPDLYKNPITRKIEEVDFPIMGDEGKGLRFSKGHIFYEGSNADDITARLLGYNVKTKEGFKFIKAEEALKRNIELGGGSSAVFEINANIRGYGQKTFKIDTADIEKRASEVRTMASEIQMSGKASSEEIANALTLKSRRLTDVFFSKTIDAKNLKKASITDKDVFFDIETVSYDSKDYMMQLGIVKGESGAEAYKTPFVFANDPDAQKALDFPVSGKKSIRHLAMDIKKSKAGDNVLKNMDEVSAKLSGAKRIIGYNIKSFDIPVLAGSGVNMPKAEVIDLFEIISSYRRTIENALGVSFGEGKGSTTLENVYHTLLNAGLVEKISGGAHSADVDVEMTRQVFKAIMPVYETVQANKGIQEFNAEAINAITKNLYASIGKTFDDKNVKTESRAIEELTKALSDSKIYNNFQKDPRAATGNIVNSFNVEQQGARKSLGLAVSARTQAKAMGIDNTFNIDLGGISGRVVIKSGTATFAPDAENLVDLSNIERIAAGQDFPKTLNQFKSLIKRAYRIQGKDDIIDTKVLQKQLMDTGIDEQKARTIAKVFATLQSGKLSDIDKTEVQNALRYSLEATFKEGTGTEELRGIVYNLINKNVESVGTEVGKMVDLMPSNTPIVKVSYMNISDDLEKEIRSFARSNQGINAEDMYQAFIASKSEEFIEAEGHNVRKMFQSIVDIAKTEYVTTKSGGQVDELSSGEALLALLEEIKVMYRDYGKPGFDKEKFEELVDKMLYVESWTSSLEYDTKAYKSKRIEIKPYKTEGPLVIDRSKLRKIRMSKQQLEDSLQELIETPRWLLQGPRNISDWAERLEKDSLYMFKEGINTRFETEYDESIEEFKRTVDDFYSMPSSHYIPANDEVAAMLRMNVQKRAAEFGGDFNVPEQYRAFKLFYEAELSRSVAEYASYHGMDPRTIAAGAENIKQIRDVAVKNAWRDVMYHSSPKYGIGARGDINVHELIAFREFGERIEDLEQIYKGAGKISTEFAIDEDTRSVIAKLNNLLSRDENITAGSQITSRTQALDAIQLGRRMITTIETSQLELTDNESIALSKLKRRIVNATGYGIDNNEYLRMISNKDVFARVQETESVISEQEKMLSAIGEDIGDIDEEDAFTAVSADKGEDFVRINALNEIANEIDETVDTDEGNASLSRLLKQMDSEEARRFSVYAKQLLNIDKFSVDVEEGGKIVSREFSFKDNLDIIKQLEIGTKLRISGRAFSIEDKRYGMLILKDSAGKLFTTGTSEAMDVPSLIENLITYTNKSLTDTQAAAKVLLEQLLSKSTTKRAESFADEFIFAANTVNSYIENTGIDKISAEGLEAYASIIGNLFENPDVAKKISLHSKEFIDAFEEYGDTVNEILRGFLNASGTRSINSYDIADRLREQLNKMFGEDMADTISKNMRNNFYTAAQKADASVQYAKLLKKIGDYTDTDVENISKWNAFYLKELQKPSSKIKADLSDADKVNAINKLFFKDMDEVIKISKDSGTNLGIVMQAYLHNLYGQYESEGSFEALREFMLSNRKQLEPYQISRIISYAKNAKDEDLGLAFRLKAVTSVKDWKPRTALEEFAQFIATSDDPESAYAKLKELNVSTEDLAKLQEYMTLKKPSKGTNIFKTETADRVAKKINDIVDFKSLKGNMRGLLPIGIMFGAFALIGAQSRAEFKRQQVEAQNLQTVNVLTSNNLLAKQMRYAPTNAEMSATVAIANQPNMNDNANVLNMLGITNGRIEYRA